MTDGRCGRRVAVAGVVATATVTLVGALAWWVLLDPPWLPPGSVIYSPDVDFAQISMFGLLCSGFAAIGFAIAAGALTARWSTSARVVGWVLGLPALVAGALGWGIAILATAFASPTTLPVYDGTALVGVVVLGFHPDNGTLYRREGGVVFGAAESTHFDRGTSDRCRLVDAVTLNCGGGSGDVALEGSPDFGVEDPGPDSLEPPVPPAVRPVPPVELGAATAEVTAMLDTAIAATGVAATPVVGTFACDDGGIGVTGSVLVPIFEQYEWAQPPFDAAVEAWRRLGYRQTDRGSGTDIWGRDSGESAVARATMRGTVDGLWFTAETRCTTG